MSRKLPIIVAGIAADGRTVLKAFVTPDAGKATEWHEAAVAKGEFPFVVSATVFRRTGAA